MSGARPSHLRGAIRLAAARLRRAATAAPEPRATPGRKQAVESRGIEVDRRRVRRYLAATLGEGTGQASARDAVLPPTYTAVWETALTLELLALEGLPFPSGGVIHLRSEIVVVRSMRSDDRFRCRLELERVEPHPRGTQLVLKSRSWNAGGLLCQENATEILVLQRGQGARKTRSARPRLPETGDGTDWLQHSEWAIGAEAGLRYARASGDFNPVHLWPWTSRLVGYSRPILHGHCSLAMIAHQLGSARGEGYHERLRKLSAVFRSPLLLPARVRLLVSADPVGGNARFRLVSVDGVEGKTFVEGEWVG